MVASYDKFIIIENKHFTILQSVPVRHVMYSVNEHNPGTDIMDAILGLNNIREGCHLILGQMGLHPHFPDWLLNIHTPGEQAI